MKQQSVFFSLTRVVIILTAAFFFGAQADDKKGGKDPRAEKFRAAEEKTWGAVKAGKLTKEAAQKKLAGLKKEIWGGDQKKDSGDKKGSGDKKEGYDKREAKFHAFEKEIWGAVKAGKLSKRDAMQKLEGLKKEMFNDQGKKDWGGKKNSGDKKKGYDKREAKFNALEKEIWGAVKAGKLSKDDAMKKLEGLKKEMFDDHGKKGRDGKKDPDIEELKRQLEALKRENEGLRKRLEKR
jgi:hypothetical protein|tara:strand:+ start:391 stop:1101 length:711 start_codon:yes stop_codon:yes gene_type:complete